MKDVAVLYSKTANLVYAHAVWNRNGYSPQWEVTALYEYGILAFAKLTCCREMLMLQQTWLCRLSTPVSWHVLIICFCLPCIAQACLPCTYMCMQQCGLCSAWYECVSLFINLYYCACRDRVLMYQTTVNSLLLAMKMESSLFGTLRGCCASYKTTIAGAASQLWNSVQEAGKHYFCH